MDTKERIAILSTVAFLNSLADRLDGWAEQSRSGGWSTHQCDANIGSANQCRRMAARLNGVIFANVDGG